MKISRTEIEHLGVAWLVLGLCFSVRYLFHQPQLFPTFFLIALIGLGTAFIGHELAHKLVAQKFGYQAEFRLWWLGLVIAALTAFLTMGRILFAAPGAVYIFAYTRPREEGVIAVSGPLANLVLAFLFYFFLGQGNGFTAIIGQYGFIINLWLAAFNLLPIPPLDGSKVMSWNLGVWIIVTATAWGLFVLTMAGIV